MTFTARLITSLARFLNIYGGGGGGGGYPDERAPYTYFAKKKTNTIMAAHEVKFNRVNSHEYVKSVQKN